MYLTQRREGNRGGVTPGECHRSGSTRIRVAQVAVFFRQLSLCGCSATRPAVPERRHAIRGLIDQFAGEVLRLANDARFIDSLLQDLLIAGCDYRQRVNRLVFAITLVSVRIKISYQRAFDDCLDSFFCRNLLGYDKRETAQAARFERAYGRSGNFS